MKIKYLISLCLIVVFLISVAGVSASSDVNQTTDSEILSAGVSDDVIGVISDENVISSENHDWYVNASASDGGDGSNITPYNNFKNVLNNTDLQDGDTVYFAGGENYAGDNNVNLTINKQLNLLKYGSGDAIFDAEKNSRIFTVTASCININGLTFVNGNADGGGAIYFENPISNSNIDATFINNTAKYGGANYFNNNVINSNITGTYINNTASFNGGANCFNLYTINTVISGTYNHNRATLISSGHGGANYFKTINNSMITGTYIENDAYMYGGANYIDTVVNSTITGIYNRNIADFGGANSFYFSISNSNITGTYSENTAKNGGANHFYWTVSNSNIAGTYTNNTATENGGANCFYHTVGNSNISGTYTNNTATEYGGANFFNNVTGSTITGIYINNTATKYGGVNYFYHTVENSNIAGTYTNNSAEYGGANYFDDSVKNSTITGTYNRNTAEYGGVNWFFYPVENSNITGIYTNNSAGDGGVNYFDFFVADSTITGIYTNNTASENGGVNYFRGFVIGSTVTGIYTNNTASENGGVSHFYDFTNSNITGTYIYNMAKSIIYFSGTATNVNISNAIFLNNKYENCIIDAVNKGVVANNNWFGNNATNYNTAPKTANIEIDTWLYLNGTDNKNKVKFFLMSYNRTANKTDNYNDAILPIVNLTLSATNTTLAKNYALLNEEISHTFSINASVTGQIENAKYTIEIKKGDFDLLQELIDEAEENSIINLERNFTYNEFDTITTGVLINKNITLNGNGFTIDAKGKSRIFIVTAESINVINIIFKNGNADYGGANYFTNPISNSNINATFINNTAKNGGANFFFVLEDSTITGTYTNNTATENAGANCFYAIKDSTITGTYINNIALLRGGANFFELTTINTIISGTYNYNKATSTDRGNGGANSFYAIKDSTITGTYTNNTAGNNGGANYFYDPVTDSNITGTYTNNTAENDGGANYFHDYVTNSTITGIYTHNTVNTYGGANCFYLITINTVVSGTYNYNKATSTDKGNGGANYFFAIKDSTITGTYTNNTAGNNGGANSFYNPVINITITGIYTNNTATENGGANYFHDYVTNLTITGTYNRNTAGNNGGANSFYNTVTGSTITGIYNNNTAACGGANCFYWAVSNSNISGTYDHNAAKSFGGSNYFHDSVTDSIITGIYNNTAAEDGGANYFYKTVADSTITGIYNNNTAAVNGGANYFYNSVTNINITGTYINNTALFAGGANHFFSSVTNINITGTYINNTASKRGGVNYFHNSVTGSTITGIYTNNTATEYEGINYFYNPVTNSNITGTYINNSAKSIIYFARTATNVNISNAIFLNNKYENCIIDAVNKGVVANNNWFGNNATNYNTAPKTANIEIDTWLYLSGTDNKNKVKFFLMSYNRTANKTDNYNDAILPIVNLTLSATNTTLAKSYALLNEEISYTHSINASVTGQIENAKYTIEIKKGDFDLLQELIDEAEEDSIINLERNFTYNELDSITTGVLINKNITINGNGFTIDAKGKSRIFNVTARSINIINIIFKNGNADYGGANYFTNPISNSNINATFINNTAINGGANYFYNTVADSTIIGTYTNNTAKENGGANYFYNNVINTNITGTYINNKASFAGGANHFERVVNSTIMGTYIENAAFVSGGANYIHTVVNSIITGIYNRNTAGLGGANYIHTVVNSIITGIYNRNTAAFGGANSFYGNVSNTNISGIYTNNTATDNGGVNHFNLNVLNTNISGIYTNNTAAYGGVNYFYCPVSNSNITGTYNRNTAAYGGVNYFYESVSNSNITGIYTKNTAEYDGGANYFCDSVSNTNISGIYTNNTAKSGGANHFNQNVSNSHVGGIYNYNIAKGSNYNGGGANYFYRFVSNTNISGTYTKNTAEYDGGANYFFWTVLNTNISGTYTDNTAEYGGVANCFNHIVTNSNITGTYINNTAKSIICFSGKNTNVNISNAIFLNNKFENCIIDAVNNGVVANNNWFGNNATNYNVAPKTANIEIDTWLYLNGTDNKNNAKFFLMSYNRTTNITDNYNDAMLPIVNLTLSATNTTLAKSYALLNEEISYTFSTNASITGQIENAKYTIEIKRGDFDLLQKLIDEAEEDSIINLERNFTYNEFDSITTGVLVNKNITLNGNGFTIDAKGKSRIFNVTARSINIINIIFKNGNAYEGGANYFTNPISNSNINATFINNTAKYGGANYFYDSVTDSTITGTYTNNTAAEDGGANYFYNNVINTNISGTYNENTAKIYGGANCFILNTINTVISGTYTNNTAAYGGANHFEKVVVNSTIMGTYIKNVAVKYGGANYFHTVVNSTITGIYTNNTATEYGGVNYFVRQVSNTNISGIYINNTARENGGVNHFYWHVSNIIITGTYTNNTANRGGVNYFYEDDVSNIIIIGIYTNNTAIENGGVNYFVRHISNSNISGTYYYNIAKGSTYNDGGGVNYFYDTVTNINISGIYTNNEANRGGVNHFNKNVSNSNVRGIYTNNTAAEQGGANYFYNNVINTNISGTYNENTAKMYGGANGFNINTINTVISGTYNHNTAAYGGANHFERVVKSSTIMGTYDHNIATTSGGANYFHTVVNSTITGIYTNNTASWGGANSYYFNVSNINISGIYTNNTATYNGGVNHFYWHLSNIIITGTYTNNAANRGGVNYFYEEDVSNIIITGTYTNNTATDNGGVNYVSKSVLNSNINGTFNNNAANRGGVNYVYKSVSNSNITGTYTENTADNGGANYFENTVSNSNIMGTYDHNIATTDGGANYFNQDVSNSNIIGVYDYNIAYRNGGANYFRKSVSNSNIMGTYDHNIATTDGGANYFFESVSNINITGTYTNNAANRGGVNCFNQNVSNSHVGGTYDYNIAKGSTYDDGGGANYFYESVSNSNIMGTYDHNAAKNFGGANCFYKSVSNSNITGTYTNNTANRGGANYFYKSVSNSNITGTYTENTANNGGANYFYWTILNSKVGGTYNNNIANSSTDYDGAGANYFGNYITNTNITGTYNHNTAKNGGANCFFNSVLNSNINGIYNNNIATTDGGANYFFAQITNSNITGTYTENTANNGGANYFYWVVLNSNVSGTYDHNAAKSFGGANYFYNNILNSYITGIYTENTAEYGGGANYFNQNVSNSNIMGTYDHNNANRGGANYFNQEVSNSNITGTFNNNAATDGDGAVNFFNNDVSNSNIVGTYIENTANHAGANYFNRYVLNSTITGTYTNNTAVVWGGGVNYFHNTVSNSNITGVYDHNIATTDGGANYFNQDVSNSNIIGVYDYNIANRNGGANYFRKSVSNSNITGIYTNNTANRGGANYFNNTVSNVAFTGNYINNGGEDVIYIRNSVSGNVICDSIFINNAPILVDSGNVSGINVWFGNNVTNYDVEPDAGNGIVFSNWLFLNATADPNQISIVDTSNIVFKLSSYDMENVFAYDNSRLIPVNLTITSTLGSVNPEHVNLDENIIYTPNMGGIGSVTATLENVFYTIEFDIEKLDSNLSVESQEVTYGESITLAISYNVNATGKVNVTLKGKNNNYTFTDMELNTTILLGDAINADEYDVTVAYSGDGRFTNATAEATLKINKANSTLTVNNIIFDYNGSGSTDISFTNATGVTAKVVGHDETIIVVGNNKITVSNLNVGDYTLTVTTVTDENHNTVTENATVTVRKINSTVDVNSTTFDYGGYAIIVAVTEGATGITAKIDDDDAEVIGNVIIVSGLDAGNYTLTVTTVPDNNHIAATKTATVTVNKINSTISVTDIIVYYGKSVNVTVTTDGAIAITADIDGENVTVKGNIITVPEDLESGNHTLTVTTVPDNNHIATTKTVKIVDCRVDDNIIVIVDGKEYHAKIVDGKVIIDTSIGKQNTTINLDVEVFENNATFTVNVKPDATGIVRFEVSGTEEYTVYADVINGVAVMDNVLEVGDYEVVATYMGDDMFNTNITSEKFTVKGHIKKDTPITADAKVNGNRVTITVNVDENATGFVGLKQSESTIYIALENGVATYVTTLPAGSYNFEVTYTGDDDYNKNSTSVLFTVVEVAKENTTISLDIETIENNATFTVNVNENATGIVKFEFSADSEQVIYTDVNDGRAVVECFVETGNYTLTVTYMGDDRFNTNTTSENFTVKGHVKKDTPISAVADVNGYKVTITVTVDGNATGFVNMKLADTEFNIALNDGVGSVTTNMPAGSYSINVTYLGDYNFNENTTILSFTVEDPVKENTPISLDVSSVEDYVTFTVNVNPDATGIVRFEVSGAEDYTVYADVINGVAVIEDVLEVGDYTVVATYMGDGRFNSNITSESFTIKGHVKKDTPITADAKVNGNRVTITVNVDENATGFVGLKQSRSTIYVALENGVATYTTTLAAGSYNFEVTYTGDDDFNENSTRLLFTVVGVPKENTTISLDVETSENIVIFTVNVNPDATGIVRFEVSGAEDYTVYADVINGVAVMEDVLEVGDYTVVATYMGDDRFNSNVTSEDFNVIGHVKKDTPISAVADVNGYRVTITVTVDANATGFVNMKLADTEFNIQLTDGVGSVATNLPANSYNIDVTYLGDYNFNENTTKLSFTVEDPVKENTPISLDVSSVEDYATFTVNVNPDATGIVRFEVSGAEDYTVYVDVINGVAVMEDVLEVGDYTVVATYMGDDRFNTNITSESFTVKGHVKKDTPISAIADVNGYKVTITVNVDEDATGFVGLKISGSTIYVPLENGVATYTATLAAGSYNVEVTYLGDDDYNGNSTRLLFTVVEVAKENTTISLDVEVVENNSTFTVNVNENATGIVQFELTGDDEYVIYVDVNDGKAVYKNFIEKGNYTITVTYMGDDRFNSNVTSESFTVKGHVKKDTPISAVADVNGYRVTITVTVDGNATGFVNMKLADTEFNIQLTDGVGSVATNLPANSYNIDVTYLGDYNFNENTTKLSFTVEDPVKENTPISLDVSSVEDYATFTVNVNPDATGIVRFEVSGAEDYTVYADVINGVAVMEDVLEVGDYTVVATYMGDGRFNSNITSESFTIKGHVKKDTSITADAKISGNRVTIIANVNESATGFVGLKISGSTIYVPLEDGVATYTATFAAGSYNVEVTYIGDDDYNGNSTRLLFTVVEVAKENTTISLDVSSVENHATFTVNVNPDATGIVRFEVSGAENYTVYADVINGVAVMEDVLEVGDYEVVATYMGDDRFNTNTTSESFTVKGHVKKDTPISAVADVNGYRVTITVTVDGNATGFVNMKLADTEFNIQLTDGVGSVATNLPANSYNIDVTYLGDYNFNENTTKLSFTVEDPVKENTPISLDVSSVEDYVTFTVNVNPDATGIVRFEVSGVEDYTVYVDVINGVAVMEDVLEVGDYTVVATYMGDDRFNTNITSESFTVKGHVKKDTPIAADAKVNGNRVTITVNVDEDATGFVGLKISGSTIYVPLENGVATYTATLAAGSYNVVVTYIGDDDYNGNSTRLLFTVVEVAKENTTISLDVSSVEDYATFTVNVNPDATGIVRFEVSGAENYTVYTDVINGVAVMEDVLEVGDYEVVATYMGDDRFNSNATSESFAIKGHVKMNTTISPDIVVDGYEVTITVTVDSNATGFVEFNIGGRQYYASVNDGKAILVADFPQGRYMGNVLYLGDDNFNDAVSLLYFIVEEEPVIVPISSEFTDIVINDDLNISMVLKDGNGNPISNAPIRYSVNGVSNTTTTLNDGSFVIKGENGAVITVIYEGNETIKGTNITVSLAPVVPVVVKVTHFDIPGGVITLNGYAVDTKAGEQGMTYATALLDEDGKAVVGVPMQFAVNDKIYNRVTDEKGSFTPYHLDMVRAGRYTMAFYFSGNENYTSAFGSVCVDLDKKPITIKASAKSYKVSTKTKSYTVTLSTKVCSSADGKAHLSSGKKVTLLVNGKTYSGKTNTKGQVTFKITNLSKKGKYTAKISYAGDITYESATKSVKLTIK